MPEKTDRTGKGFRKLLVWQRAHALVLQVYKFTEKFPKHELFGLTSQLRRAVVSVPANVGTPQRRMASSTPEYFIGGRRAASVAQAPEDEFVEVCQARAEVEFVLLVAAQEVVVQRPEARPVRLVVGLGGAASVPPRRVRERPLGESPTAVRRT